MIATPLRQILATPLQQPPLNFAEFGVPATTFLNLLHGAKNNPMKNNNKLQFFKRHFFFIKIYQNAQISQYLRFSHRDVHALKPPSKRAMKPSTKTSKIKGHQYMFQNISNDTIFDKNNL